MVWCVWCKTMNSQWKLSCEIFRRIPTFLHILCHANNDFWPQNENWEFHMKILTMRIFAKKWFHCGKKCTKILAFNEKSHVRIFNWGSSLCPCKALLWLLAGGPGHWSEEFHSPALENSFCVATNVWWILMPSHCPVTSFCGVVPDLGGPVLSVVPVAPSQLAQWH